MMSSSTQAQRVHGGVPSERIFFDVAVPRHFLIEEETYDFSDTCFREEKYHKYFSCQAEKGDTFESIFTPKKLEWLGVVGAYEIHLHSTKCVDIQLDGNLDVLNYLKTISTCGDRERPTIEVVPKENPIWEKCKKMTNEEVNCAKSILRGYKIRSNDISIKR